MFLLVLVSGPKGRPDGIQHLASKAGWGVEAYDSVNGADHNLADDAVWDPIRLKLESGGFDAVLASPPCTTASRLRKAGGGPPPLRGTEGRQRYGLPDLSIKDKELVR